MTLKSAPVKLNLPTSAAALLAEMNYLARVIRMRLALHCKQQTGFVQPEDIPRPVHEGPPNPYLSLLQQYAFSHEEHIVLLTALAPHIQPEFFDQIIAEALPEGGDFPQIGGVRGRQFRGFIPTAETALFLLAGDDLERRFAVQKLFCEEHVFARTQLLRVEPPPAGEPLMSGKLVLDSEFIDLVTLGQVARPQFSMDFPAKRITTEMGWDDLVLPAATVHQVSELKAWIQHGDTLLFDWGMKKKLKRGYRVLFHGPPGTGKTLTATLLGKYTGRDVYRVDLAMVVSKFIGETEKNLANLFDKAENKDWILFFDEADALFGKRTNVRDAHDRYANQEIAYLLQRVEDYDGLVILASNFKNNIDDAFLRRFQAAIHFPVPGVAERLKLWRLAFPDAVKLAADVQLELFSRQYELSGAHIMNAVQYACLRSLERGDCEIQAADLNTGIRREVSKEGKTV